MASSIRLVLGALAIIGSIPTAQACSISNDGWPWDVAHLRKLWAEGLAREPDEFVFAGKVRAVSRAHDRKTDDGQLVDTEIVDFEVIGVMKGAVSARLKLLNLSYPTCFDWQTPPVGKLTFVMAKPLAGETNLEATMFAVDEDSLSLLIAFTNAGMRARPPKP